MPCQVVHEAPDGQTDGLHRGHSTQQLLRIRSRKLQIIVRSHREGARAPGEFNIIVRCFDDIVILASQVKKIKFMHLLETNLQTFSESLVSVLLEYLVGSANEPSGRHQACSLHRKHAEQFLAMRYQHQTLKHPKQQERDICQQL